MLKGRTSTAISTICGMPESPGVCSGQCVHAVTDSGRGGSPPALPPNAFRTTLRFVEVHPSARKHGVADEDIRHAIDHALAIEDAGEDPDRWLVIGPDRAGNLLEVVVLVTIEGAQLVIHAMRMRTKFGRLIEP